MGSGLLTPGLELSRGMTPVAEEGLPKEVGSVPREVAPDWVEIPEEEVGVFKTVDEVGVTVAAPDSLKVKV